jgi:hypothetical protein
MSCQDEVKSWKTTPLDMLATSACAVCTNQLSYIVIETHLNITQLTYDPSAV